MVDDVTSKGSTTLEVLRGQDPKKEQKEAAASNDTVQREDFLQILVTQLQNQDPLNPMSNDQFAVDLAQFSQLEQLINLNEKFDQQPTDVGSLAQYLGRQVSVESDQINLSAPDSEQIEIKLASPAQVTVDLTDAAGEVVSSLPMGQFEQGSHALDISELTNLTGSYGFQVSGIGGGGDRFDVESQLLGRVTGFVPGPNGALLVGDREVNMQDVKLVRE